MLVTYTNSRLIPEQLKIPTINILHDSPQPQQLLEPFSDVPLKFIDKVSWPQVVCEILRALRMLLTVTVFGESEWLTTLGDWYHL